MDKTSMEELRLYICLDGMEECINEKFGFIELDDKYLEKEWNELVAKFNKVRDLIFKGYENKDECYFADEYEKVHGPL